MCDPMIAMCEPMIAMCDLTIAVPRLQQCGDSKGETAIGALQRSR